MLCLKKKKFWGSSSSSSYGPQSQSKTFGMEQKGSGSGTSSIEEANKRGSRDPSRSNGMAPPPTAAVPAVNPLVREVTEDTPPDLLEGTMDLLVILPSGKTVQTTVDRKTPVMDLLVHTATANKINPAGHIVQVRNERGIEMPYKPSTPIGALDTTTIEIVPKNRVNEYIIVKQPVKVANQPFETTFRLQVHLPRNQLYVMRISPKTLLDEILREVCQEKNLDINKYEIRHPVNLDQRLSPSLTVGDTGLQELTIVSKNSKINSSVSTADILAIQQQNEDCRGKGCLDGSFKHSRSSVGDSSVSSESTGSAGSGRGISPCRSEDSRSISPLPLIRPKTLIQSRPSYISTCSSSGNSSAGLHRMNTVDGCTMSRQLSQSPQPMQAPPRTKKRAAPKPPSPAVSTLSVNVNCSTGAPSNISTSSPISEKNPILCSTPINGSSNGNSNNNGTGIGNANGNDNVSLSNGSKSPGKLQELRPTPRKKEAPREPPSSKHHTPLSHHQSLPLNHHSRHSSGNVEHHQETGACVPQDQNDSRQLDRLETPATQKMSGKHSMSSSMTNLTSVSSVSSTSLASSTGGSKKRRAPKPPALGAVKTPSQIEEERETTTAESTLRSGVEVDVKIGSHLPNQQPSSTRNQKSVVGEVASDDDSKEMKVLSPSPMSSLSSRSESTTPSPIPPQQLSPKSNNSVSVLNKMKERHSSLNINQDSGPEKVGVHDEYGSESRGSNSRSSTPSSCNNLGNNVIGATSHPSPDSVRSRKNRVSVVVEEASPTASSRPPTSSSNTQDENESHNNENEVTCHSSESEASYTDSGVPATETVTPSPVNLDDVILDHDHEDHSGSHQEKFSSEDGDTRKHSSRRSSLESEHSNDWMNSMQSKLNKEEEDVEKMFEAALTHPGEESSGFESATLLDDDDAEKESDAAILAARNSNNKKEEDEAGEKEMIVTTVQLHHIPSTHQSKDEEPENDEVSHPEPEIVASSNNQQVRKLSKSESFSHHSEFDEATQKRKVYSSARSVNNLKLSSQNSGSATELTQGLSSEERENPGTIMMEQSSLEHKVQSTGPVLNKTTSLGTLSVESSNKDGNVTMDMYRKQLEMQFEQWKQEFIKNHQGNASDVPSDKAIMAEVAKKIQVKQSEDLKQKSVELTAEPLKEEEVKQRSESRNSEVLRASSPEAPAEIEVRGETVGTACSEEKPIKDIKDESHKTKIEDVLSSRDTVANEPVKISVESSIEIETKEESAPEENMKGADDFPVELRRKTATKQTSPPAVYQYSGPPTIKMASWNERPRRAVSVKDDDDYIMGFGQQDASNKPSVASRIHSFHGAGPVVQVENSMKSKRESSPNPSIPVVKGWSAAINAPSTVSGSVRSVLSTWKQKMEETEKEKNKPREGPPAEIDIYGGSENSENQLKPKIANGTTFKKEPSVTVTTVAPNKSTSVSVPAPVSVSVEEQQTKPVVITAKPTINTVKQEKFQTLGSSFRSEKPVNFSISPMESNTLPRNKPVSAAKSFTDTVDAKPSAATSVIEVNGSADSGSTTGTMEQRKKFFQGVKPVENGKEAPVPATNMKNNIAAIQKVFEKQRVTKMQQMGSQQSLHSEGTVSPVPSLQRNDSLESRHSSSTSSTNNNINNKQVLQRQNSLESHSSDSSSVVLRVSSGKVSPQLSSTEMVQKLFGRPNSFNIDAARRTPSPISSTTSTLSSSTSYERFTPSPTVVDGPNNSVRITTGGYKPQPQNQQTSNIRSVGNKAIIIVNGADTPSAKSAEDRDKRAMIKQSSTVNDNIILESGRKLQPKKSLVSASYVSAIAQDLPPKKTTAAPVPPPPAPAPTPVKPTQLSFSQKSGRVQANGTTPPPPPPPPVDIVPLKPVATSPSGNTLRNSKPSTPSTPTSPDPRSEIFNAIKNSNGNFGLRKTGSSILMK